MSKQLVEYVLKHQKLQGLRRILLTTLDAYELYKKYNFKSLEKAENLWKLLIQISIRRLVKLKNFI